MRWIWWVLAALAAYIIYAEFIEKTSVTASTGSAEYTAPGLNVVNTVVGYVSGALGQQPNTAMVVNALNNNSTSTWTPDTGDSE